MPVAPPTGGVEGTSVVTDAEAYIGDPYVYGAAGPDTFDCSGLVQFVYGLRGIHLPRTSEEQYAATARIGSDQLRPGDLVFSAGSDGTASHPGHVGIYAGARGGTPTVLEAPHTGASVRLTPLSSFDASAYGRVKGITTPNAVGADWQIPVPGLGSVDVPSPSDVAGAAGLGGLLSLPKDVVGFFGKATDDLTGLGKFFWAFTQPSTWVRIGAGWLGFLFLVAGLAFLILAGVRP